MARRNVDPQRVAEEVAGLGDLDLAELRKRWHALYGNPAPKSIRREFLIRACAYQMQVKAFGGLSAATKRRLRAIADGVSSGRPVAAPAPKIKPGTRFVRSWGGEVHVVTAVDGGFEYQGERYRSLSAIATSITGTNWNGHAFFGLKNKSNTPPVTAGHPIAENRPRRGAHGPRVARNGSAAVSPTTSPPSAHVAPVSAQQLEMFNG
jgi:hypothetical protein